MNEVLVYRVEYPKKMNKQGSPHPKLKFVHKVHEKHQK